MDCGMKTPSWVFAELERGTERNIGSVVRFSNLGKQKRKADCSVDLKLGRLSDFSDRSLDKWKDSSVLEMVSPSGSSKRARVPSNGSHIVSCLVDGCKSDLSNCRDYHRRHKVCEVHAKSPTVIVGGQQQRFCQQCSRFHLLMEFDEEKRSCRKRLDGHNRRRRKPQLESLAVNSGSLFANHQGTNLSTYITPQVLVSITSDPNWANVIKAEADTHTHYTRHSPLHISNGQCPFPTSYSSDYKGGKQFPFLQGSNSSSSLSSKKMLEIPGHTPLDAIASSASSGNKAFSDGLTRVLDSDCALSLLSSPTQASGIGLSRMVVPADQIPMAQPLVAGMQYDSMGQYSCSQASNSVSSTGFSCSGIVDEQVGTILVPDGNDTDLRYHGIFQVGDGSSERGATRTLPFSW